MEGVQYMAAFPSFSLKEPAMFLSTGLKEPEKPREKGPENSHPTDMTAETGLPTPRCMSMMPSQN